MVLSLSKITYTPPNWTVPKYSRLKTLILKRDQSGTELPPEINPEQVAVKYMTSSIPLTSKERRFIPICLLDQRVANFQPELFRKTTTDRSIANKHSFWKKLLRSFVLNYPKDLNLRNEIRHMISKQRAMFRPELINLCESIGVLGDDPQQVATAECLLKGTLSVEATSYMAFSTTGQIGSRYAEHLIEILCLQIGNSNFDERKIRNLIKLIAPSNEIAHGIRPSALVGLIKPMKNQPQKSELVMEILKLITATFGDPRLSDSNYPMLPENLGGLASRNACINIIKSWYNFRSMELFFNIIEQVIGADSVHQFPRRRKFWEYYFEKGLISDVWVVLGPNALHVAQGVFFNNEEEDYQSLRYGRLRSSRNDHSALLMKIGNLIICEWSHLGKVRFWTSKCNTAPKFFQENIQYEEQKLKLGELNPHSRRREELIPGITHDNPRNLGGRDPSWVKKTNDVINRWASIRKRA